MNNQIVTVNLIPGLSTPAVVRVSQYDVGRPITFNILDGASAASISSSMTVTVVGTKPSGLGFSQSAVIASLSTVTINTTLAMTQECGMIPAEIRFTQSGENVGTANFIIAVEPSPHPDGTTDGTQETMQNLETRLQGQIDALDTRVDALEAGQGGGSGLTDDVKNALLNCFAHVAWVDADGQDYYDALESALDSGDLSVSLTLSQVSSSNTATTVGYGESYTTTLTASTGYTLNTVSVTMGGVDITSTAYSSGTVSIPSVTGNIVIMATAVLAAQSITATYTQSGTVYDTDTLDSLKADLVVTANYSGGTSETVPASGYTLSGTLTEGTSTITVSYAGLTDTFTVTVTHAILPIFNWDFTQSLVDSVSSQTAVLGSIVSAHAPTRDSNGVYIEFNDAYIDLGNIYQPSRTVEIDFGTMSRQGTANGRLLMVGDGSATGGLGTGFIYRSNNTWNWYSGGWDTPISGTTEPNYFSGKTLRAVFDADGHMSVYDGNTLLGTSTKVFATSAGTSLQIGAYSGNGSYSNFYTMYVRAVRIYEV